MRVVARGVQQEQTIVAVIHTYLFHYIVSITDGEIISCKDVSCNIDVLATLMACRVLQLGLMSGVNKLQLNSRCSHTQQVSPCSLQVC